MDMPAKKPTYSKERPNEVPLVNGKIVPWGETNDFPQKLIDLGQKSTLIPSTMEKKVNFLYGKGVRPMLLVDYDSEGNEVLQPVKPGELPEVWEFMRRSNVNRYIMEAANDFYWFLNPFPELILSKNRKKIVQLVAQEATDCRWETMDSQGKVKHCYINSNWPDQDNQYIKKVKALDPYDPYRWEWVQEDSAYQYIYPLSFPSPGKKYYQLAPWYAAEQSGWLAVAQSIPTWKKALMTNQITLKYIIQVPDYWWEWKFPDWKSMKPKERLAKQQEQYNKFETFLAGAEKAGKSILSTSKTDPMSHKDLGGLRIEAVDTKMKDGMYIEDSQEASAHLLYSLGVDPTLVGFSSGKETGSGSDKRVAYNMYIENIEPHRELILEPLYFISQYNGWPEELRWKFQYSQISTLQNGQETTTKTT